MTRALFSALVALCVIPATAAAQRPAIPPATAGELTTDKYQVLMHDPPVPETEAKEGRRISVTVRPSAGPVGQVFIQQPLQGVFTKAETAKGEGFRYPSIYLTMSATPVIVPVKKSGAGTASDPVIVKDALYDDLDLRWLDVTVELDALDKDGKALACEPKNVEVLGLLPSQTVAGLGTSKAPEIAGAIDEGVDVVLPFVPGPGAVAKAASSLATILFKNLFPPKPTAYQYASLERGCRFGWYFKQDDTSATAPSLLGLHSGAVLLRTSKDVESIRVRHSVLSRWNTKLGNKTDFNYFGAEDVVTLPKPAPPPKLTDLADISELPVMVAKADAIEILQIDEAEYLALIADKTNNLRVVAKGNFVTRSSLESFLGLQKKKE